jgi:hypothetical protein
MLWVIKEKNLEMKEMVGGDMIHKKNEISSKYPLESKAYGMTNVWETYNTSVAQKQIMANLVG